MKKTSTDFLAIGEIAKRSGIAISAIRFYEEKGLIRSIRTNGNQRRYARYILRKLAVIQVSQKVGLSLQDILEAFNKLPEGKIPTKQDWQNMSMQWQQQLEERIIVLKNMQHQLDWCIGCGCLSLDACPLRNPNDNFSEHPEIHEYWEDDYVDS